MGKSKVAGKILERPSGLGWRKLHLCSHSSNMLSCLFSMIINTFNFFSMIASHSRLNNLILTWSTCISAGYLYETIFTFNLKRKKERRKWLTDFSSFCLLSSSASPCLLPSCVTLVCHTKTHHCSLCRNGGGSLCPLDVSEVWIPMMALFLVIVNYWDPLGNLTSRARFMDKMEQPFMSA